MSSARFNLIKPRAAGRGRCTLSSQLACESGLDLGVLLRAVFVADRIHTERCLGLHRAKTVPLATPSAANSVIVSCET